MYRVWSLLSPFRGAAPHGLRLPNNNGFGFARRASSSDGVKKHHPFAGISLSEPLPSLAASDAEKKNMGTAAQVAARAPRHVEESAETVVTTLSNGVRVASEPCPGRFCTVGVIVDSGSRYEVGYPSGVSHFLEKLAFGATEKFENKDDILNRLEKFGGICDCQSMRDTFLYASSVEKSGLEPTVEILGDVVLRPRIEEEELEYARACVQFEIEDTDMKPDQETLLNEAIHAAAFSNNTLGLPKVCPTTNVSGINREILSNFLGVYHSPERMVVAGVGVDHDSLVRAVEKHFVDQGPSFKVRPRSSVDRSAAQYTGSRVTIPKDLSNASLGPTPMPDLAHVSIGLEAVSHQHPDFIAFCVLNMLLGGGGSFSAGGPGKGMYTRLYTNVLNRHHWMYSATAFNHAYADAGLFCIAASGPPTKLGETVRIIVAEMTRLTQEIGDEEFNRAKKQLTSMLLMNLEARPVIFEDVARQVLAQGHRYRAERYIERIAAVEKCDINKIAEKMLATKPAIAAIGNLDRLPENRDIELALLDRRSDEDRFKLKFFT